MSAPVYYYKYVTVKHGFHLSSRKTTWELNDIIVEEDGPNALPPIEFLNKCSAKGWEFDKEVRGHFLFRRLIGTTNIQGDVQDAKN